MPEALTSIRNIGPSLAAAFEGVGIRSAEDLRDIGTDAAYRRLLEAGHRPHFIAYYVIEMGLQGRPWNDCAGKEKADLRRRFDAIKASVTVTADAGIERILNEIGVVPRRP